ncbi:la-related protein 6A isoform X1 [Cucurbita pepo subsp. pepo]|uniref:la-related protein 6A isoform X1 n=1 Tax=Cucurbita pepo subsp. pepo TaxID=3664 RepID=UPI000C9D4A84|nr:la-related protein 6A isoform X1 [Cucurbita pepo subsp. pepo]
MAGDEPPSSASTAAVSCSVGESIPSPLTQDPVGSPSHDVPEIQSLTSEDDHEQGHEGNQDHAVRAAVLSEDLKQRIIKQVEYYFSNENLPTDKYMLGLIKKNKEGFVPVAIIAAFKRMKKLTQDHSFIAAALRESSVLVVSPNGKKVKRLHPIPLPETRDPKLFTILVENLPEDHSEENIQRIFGAAGRIRSITICDPQVVDKSGKSSKGGVLISNKLHALVEYETLEASEKAVATLNDEQDWRNGMRVKPFKHLVKHGQKKQHWRVSDPDKNGTGRLTDHSCPDKNSTGRTTDQNVDEEIQNITEHHEDVPDEVNFALEGDHQHKDKHGHRGRNQGRTRRKKYKGVNAMGHGTTTSAHHIELPKPPPGPKMPDGTRGFTMGRGRPPTSNQSS